MEMAIASCLSCAPPSSSVVFPFPSRRHGSLFTRAPSLLAAPDNHCCRIFCYVDEKGARESSRGEKHSLGQGTMGDMYHQGPSHDRGFLKVSDIHTIYYETFGNPTGKPAVFLHGGPGAGCVPRHACFFDPQFYRIILFDQRGCGKSTPRGCLEENTTWDLVEDLEKLRKHLRVNKWLVMGGSWGVTLALAYGQTYPDVVLAFILRGVCMLRQAEINWFYKQGGASSLFPFAWDELLSGLDPSEHEAVVPAFYRRLTSNDAEVQLRAARAWLKWEMGLSFFSVSQSVYYWDSKQYSVRPVDQEVKSRQKQTENDKIKETIQGPHLQSSSSKPQDIQPTKSPTPEVSGPVEMKAMTSQVAQARLECHYFLHGGFLQENQLLEGVPMIRHVPCVIVQGRYDFVCPVKNAFDLHRAWPEAELYIGIL